MKFIRKRGLKKAIENYRLKKSLKAYFKPVKAMFKIMKVVNEIDTLELILALSCWNCNNFVGKELRFKDFEIKPKDWSCKIKGKIPKEWCCNEWNYKSRENINGDN